VIDAGEYVLEGLFVCGLPGNENGAVIAPPHPQLGGSMDSAVVNEIAYALAKAGRASLRFNWRGVGASSGAIGAGPAEADRDYGVALDYLAETIAGRIMRCGYSFGALAASRELQASDRVDKLLLISPPVAYLDVPTLDTFFGEVLVVSGENDPYAPLRELEEVVNGLPHGRLEVVPEADHFFGVGLAALGQRIYEWADQE